MQIAERFEVDAPASRTWAVLRDPESIAACFPGVEVTERSDPTYTGRMTVRFGPTVATFTGRAEIQVDEQGRSGTIEARGQDRHGSSRATASATVRLLEDGDTSIVEVTGAIDVAGPLASFAESGGAHLARLMFADFAACVADRARPVDAGDPTPSPVAEIPSAFRLAWRLVLARIAALRSRWRRPQ